MKSFWRRWLLVVPGVSLQNLLRKVLRRPKLVLILFGLALVLVSPGLNQLRMLIAPADMLDEHSSARRDQELAKRAFPGDQELSVFFCRRDHSPLTNQDLCQIRSWVRRTEFKNQELQFVNSPFGIRVGEEGPGVLHYPTLVQLSCDNDDNKDGRSATAPLAPFASSPFQGIVVGPEQDSLLIDLFLRNTIGASRYGSFDPSPVGALAQDLKSTFPTAGPISVTLGAGAAFKWYFVKSLLRDQGLNLMIILVICIVYRALFGTWRGGLILVASLVLTTTFLFALMGLTGTPIDILTNSLFTIIALAAAEDFLYLSHAQQHMAPTASWRQPFRELLLPSLYTSLTTMVGFGSLWLSDIAPIKRLGLWAAVGALLEFIIIFFVLPALLELFPRLRLWTARSPTRLTSQLSRASSWRLPIPIFRALLTVLGLSVVGFFHLNLRDSLESMWDSNHPFNLGTHQILKSLGWNGTLDLVLRHPEQVAEHHRLLTEISKIPGVVRLEDPYAILDFADKSVSGSNKSLLRRELAVSDLYRRHFSSSEPLVRASIFTAESDLTSLQPIRKRVAELCRPDRCFLTGDLATYAAFSDDVITTLIGSFLISLVIVAAILFGLARALKVRNIMAVLISAIWGPCVLLGLTPLIFQGVNFVTCLFASVLVGLAGDSAVQFLFASRRGGLAQGVSNKSLGSVQMTLVAFCASLVYLGSDFAQPRILGVLFASGYICLLIGDLWILRGFLRVTMPPLRASVSAEPVAQ